MYNKKHLGIFRLTYLNFKKLSLIYFVPVIILFLYIPLMAFANISMYGFNHTAFYQIFMLLQTSIPFTSCLWVLFVLADYTESNIRELYYTYKKSVLIDFVIIFLWYVMHVVYLFIGMSVFTWNYMPELPVILMQCTVFASAAYFLLFLTKTMFIPFILILLYQIFIFAFPTETTLQFNMINPMFPTQDMFTAVSNYMPLLLISLALIILGDLLFRVKR